MLLHYIKFLLPFSVSFKKFLTSFLSFFGEFYPSSTLTSPLMDHISHSLITYLSPSFTPSLSSLISSSSCLLSLPILKTLFPPYPTPLPNFSLSPITLPWIFKSLSNSSTTTSTIHQIVITTPREGGQHEKAFTVFWPSLKNLQDALMVTPWAPISLRRQSSS